MRALILVLLLCTACTPQVAQYKGAMRGTGEQYEWVAVEDTAHGFLITVERTNGERDAIAAICKTLLLSQASAYAGKRGKNIRPIIEQRITMSVGWIGLTPGCVAQVPVEWQ